MAGVENLGGIGISIVADASQVRKTFDEAIRPFTNKKVKVIVSAQKDDSFAKIQESLRNLDVTVTLRLSPNRESARFLKRSFQERIAAEGGVLVPVKMKAWTKAEATVIKDGLLTSLGVVEIPIHGRWAGWVGGGPPSGATMGVRGRGPGPGPGPRGRPSSARGPTTNAWDDPDSFEWVTAEQPGATRQQTRQRPLRPANGPTGLGLVGPEEKEEPAQAAAPGEKKRRKPRLNPRKWRQREGETPEEFNARLEEVRMQAQERLDNATTERPFARAYNDISRVNIALKTPGHTGILPVPKRGEENRYPERVDSEGKVVRGGPKVGPLMSDVAADAFKASGSRPGERRPGAGEQLRELLGIKLDTLGNVTDIGEAGGALGLNASNIEKHLRGIFTERSVGAGGLQRTGRSFFEQFAAGGHPDQRAGTERMHAAPTWAEMEAMRRENIARVGKKTPSEAFQEEIEQGLSRDYMADARAKGRFKTTLRKRVKNAQGMFFTPPFGAAAWEGEQALNAPPPKGMSAEDRKGWQGDIGKALSVLLPARANLLAQGRAGKIPGVGQVTVQRAADPRVERPEKQPSPAQFDFLMKADVLGGLIGEAFRRIDESTKDLLASQRGRQGAETREAYPRDPAGRAADNGGVEGPTRRVIPRPELTQGRSNTDFTRQGKVKIWAKTESDEDFAIRQAAAEKKYRDDVEAENLRMAEATTKFEARRAKAQAAEQKRLATARGAGAEAEDVQGPTVEDLQPGTPIQPGSVFDYGDQGGDYGDGGDNGYFFGGGDGGGPFQVEVINWPEGFGSNMARAAGPAEPTGGQNSLNQFLGLYGDDLQKLVQDRMAAKGEKEPTKAKELTPEEKAAQEKLPGGKAGLTLTAAIAHGQRLGIAPLEEGPAVAPTANAPLTARDQTRQNLAESSQYARTAVELSPARAVATAAGQVAANLPFLGGRSGILRRSREAIHATGEATAADERLQDAEAALVQLEHQRDELGQVHNETLTEEEKRLKTLTPAYKETEDRIKGTTEKIKILGDESDEAADKAIKLNRGVAGASDIIRSFGAGVLGTITGQILFQAALGGTQAAIELGSKALGPYIERVTGYHEATNQITNALSDQTRAANGWVKVVVAQSAAQAHLNEQTFASIQPFLEQRAAIEAGNKAYQDQIKLVAAAHNLQAAQRGGLDKGLFETTGGLSILGFDTPIGGTPSTQELVGQQIDSAIRGREEAPSRAIGNFLSNLLTQTPEQTFDGGFEGAVTDFLDTFDRASANYTDTLDSLNRDFRGTGIEFVNANDAMAASVTDAAKALDDAGFDDIANQVRRGLVSLTRESVGLGKEGLQQGLAQFNQRQQRPDIDVLLQGLREQAIPALMYGIEQNKRNQLETFLPAQRGLRYAQQPVAPFGRNLLPMQFQGAAGGGTEDQGFFREGGYSPFQQTGAMGGFANGQGFFREAQTGGVSGIGGQFGGVPQSAIDSFEKYRDEAQTAIDAINAKAEQGQRVLVEKLGVPASKLAELKTLGERISDINQQQANIRLDLQYSQFNRQLYLANRQIADMAGLTDRAGSSQIGMLEREQQLLGRRSQELSIQSAQLGLQTQQLQLQSGELAQQANILQIERAQRQINFQQAVAGFTAPGITPEERAARIEEAKLEASFAQKQLDFQKQQVTIQQQNLAISHQQYELQAQSVALSAEQLQSSIALQEALNARGFEDALAAAAELQKAFDATTEIQALQDLGGVLQEQAGLVSEDIGAFMQSGEQLIQAHAQFTQDLISQTGEFVVGTVQKVQTVFDQAASAFERSGLGRFLGFSGGTSTDSSTTYANVREGGHAEGFVGRVSGTTSMTVGEAGAEEVAILRNPREVMMPVGGGGGGLTVYMPITITGNNIRSEDDMEKLVVVLTGRVEEALGRRASAFGFRSTR